MNCLSFLFFPGLGVVNLASHRVFFLHVKKFYLIQFDWLLQKKLLEASGMVFRFHSLQVTFFYWKPKDTHVNCARTTRKLRTLKFKYDFLLRSPILYQICSFWESRHFGVVNYADCRLAFLAVIAWKKILGFGKKVRFVINWQPLCDLFTSENGTI